jgi:putative flavoprotein involved in K+ transport
MDFPTKNEMAAYLEAYATRFSLPVRLNAHVRRLAKKDDHFLLTCDEQDFEAQHVVVASGAFQTPRVPAFAADLDPRIVQLHAAHYRNPAQMRPGPTLVVGAGNSGAEIAIESAQAGHQTWLAGRETGHIPARAYAFGGRPFWFFANGILSVETPIGRRVRAKAINHGGPLISLSMSDVVREGVLRAPRMTAVVNGRPALEDGRIVDVSNVVWCTGFGNDFGWIELPIFASDGTPMHERGTVPSQPGLYFVGLPFLSKLASALIGGVGGDAKHVVDAIAARTRPPSKRPFETHAVVGR